MAGRPEEYFWRGHEQCWAQRWGASGPAEYVRAALREGTSANGVFGAKVMWPHMPDLFAKLSAIQGDRGATERELLERAFPKLHFIWLWRDDLVAQAVSFSRAIQTNEWTAGAHRRPGSEPRFDFAHIDRLLSELREHNKAARRWFAANGIHPFPVRYEDLAQDSGGVTHSLLGFLGAELPCGAVIEPQHRKQVDCVNGEWIARYLGESQTVL